MLSNLQPEARARLNTNRHFDFLAQWYDRLIRPPDPRQLQKVLDLPTEGMLLDAGGGTGRIASSLHDMVGCWIISDLSLPMLRQVKEKRPPTNNIQINMARVECLPFQSGIFARILVVDAFHHFGDQPGALRELARLLKPGGRLVIEEPDIRRSRVKLIALGETLAMMGSRFRTGADICAMLKSLGLHAKFEDDGLSTYWVTATKE